MFCYRTVVLRLMHESPDCLHDLTSFSFHSCVQVELEQVHNWRFVSPLDPVYKACHCAPSDMYRNGLTDLADWTPQNVENGLLQEGLDYFLNLFEVKRYWKSHMEDKSKEQVQEKEKEKEPDPKPSTKESDQRRERANDPQHDNNTQAEIGVTEVAGEERENSSLQNSSALTVCDVEGTYKNNTLTACHPPTGLTKRCQLSLLCNFQLHHRHSPVLSSTSLFDRWFLGGRGSST